MMSPHIRRPGFLQHSLEFEGQINYLSLPTKFRTKWETYRDFNWKIRRSVLLLMELDGKQDLDQCQRGFLICSLTKPTDFPDLFVRAQGRFPAPTGRNFPGALSDGEENVHSLAGHLQRERAKEAAICNKWPLPPYLPSQGGHRWKDSCSLIN